MKYIYMYISFIYLQKNIINKNNYILKWNQEKKKKKKKKKKRRKK